MIFFTADNHFGHWNINNHCNRGFSTLDEMNETLIYKWNKVVTNGDTIYVLGDFAFKCKDPDIFLNRLNGKKHLIIGNHDNNKVIRSSNWLSVNNLLEINVFNQAIVLCHYSMRCWHNSMRGAWHLFGHSHGKLPSFGLSFDVGVDAGWDMAPVSFNQVKEKMENRNV